MTYSLNLKDFQDVYEVCANELGPDAPTIIEVLNVLPSSLAYEAKSWGWNDTVVRDDLYVLMNDMMVKKAKPVEPMVTITVEEYNRLQAIEELLWNIECDLPSGLESWIDYEELNKLRG
ncbi:hypothetical protein KNT62_gp198 [Escherichia phage phiC120]|uniref:Uncharacterized protein n=1 Tax=Escherichia phage phiC120 TaxID=1970776 RepID=A0A1W6JUM2_9CAUD|nr:hypothetical protein KNT62_gp198 [Escherichia phage phiC120]ARM70905.1 hypothetical protein phiC120_c200 [Escherichia phage phiC120]